MDSSVRLTLSILPEGFAICKLRVEEEVPYWVLSSGFFSVTRTPEELSIVCFESNIPMELKSVRGWRCIKVLGRLDLTLVGILASLASALASAGVSVFAVSTYDTDYLLVRKEDLAKAVSALRKSGHTVLAMT